MRFVVDECTGPKVAQWLRDQGHNVFSVYDEDRGLDDDKIIRKAFEQNSILITNDRDFGEKVFKYGKPHKGIILLRLDDERSHVKIDTLRRLLESHGDRLGDQFVVVTEKRVRFARTNK